MIPFYCCKWCDWCDFRSCSFVQNVSNMQRQKETHRDSSIKMNQCWLKFSFVSGLWLWSFALSLAYGYGFDFDFVLTHCAIVFSLIRAHLMKRFYQIEPLFHGKLDVLSHLGFIPAHILVFWYAQTFWHVSKQQLFASMQKRVPDKISIKINELRRVFHRMSYFMNENFATK